MNAMISFVMTWPGTMIGKPGGYGITKFADTSSGPLGQPLVDLRAVELDVLAVRGVVGHEERRAHVPFLGGALRVVAEGVVEALKSGRSGTSSTSDFTRASKAACSASPPSASRFSVARAMSARTLIRCARSLRVLLMLIWTSTLLREVLLIWMSCSLASSALNWVPS